MERGCRDERMERIARERVKWEREGGYEKEGERMRRRESPGGKSREAWQGISGTWETLEHQSQRQRRAGEGVLSEEKNNEYKTELEMKKKVRSG